MTDQDFDPEAWAAAVTADPALQAAVDAVRSDPEQMAEHLSGGMPIAMRRAAVEGIAATASPVVAERLQRILLHPAATRHWDEAMDLVGNLDVSTDTAVRALDALAGSRGGGRTAN